MRKGTVRGRRRSFCAREVRRGKKRREGEARERPGMIRGVQAKVFEVCKTLTLSEGEKPSAGRKIAVGALVNTLLRGADAGLARTAGGATIAPEEHIAAADAHAAAGMDWDTAVEESELLSADGAGGFIYPAFQPAIDGMTATVRLLEYLAVRNMPLSKVVADLPPFHLVKEVVECPWEQKGTVMRLLINQTAGSPVEIAIAAGTDAVRIDITDHGPGIPAEAQCRIFARFYRPVSYTHLTLPTSDQG